MITFKDVVEAQNRIQQYINPLPLIHSPYFSKVFKSEIFFKAENLQLTGSFKIRGALNKILSLSAEEKKIRHNNSFIRKSCTGNSLRGKIMQY